MKSGVDKVTIGVWAFIVCAVWFSLPAGIGDAWAQRGQSCDSCEVCTKLLESNDAKVELTGDIVHSGDGACIVIRGRNTIFDGMERDIRPVGGKGTVGVRVEGERALVRNVHVIGAEVGIEVIGASATTLFHTWIAALNVGIRVERAGGFRLTRSVIQGGTVGVSFGAAPDGTCGAETVVTSGAAVVLNTTILDTEVGIAACDAYPVLRGNQIFKNGTGIRLNAPGSGELKGEGAKAPYDDCVCKPELSDVRPGSAMFYSSGCHGCLVHEAWLDDLKKKGHDIRLRASGPENVAASREYDVFIDRCLPQLTDVIGVPGCVPNYSCLTTDVTHKVRNGEEGMVREVEINSPEQLAAFEAECKRVAERSYRTGEGCVIHQLQDNLVCHNRGMDIVMAAGENRWPGVGNTCGKAEGYQDVGAGGCEKTCGELPKDPVMSAARERKEAPRPPTPPVAEPTQPVLAPPVDVNTEPTAVAQPPVPAPDGTHPTSTPTPEVGSQSNETTSDNRLVYIGLLILGMLVVVAVLLVRRGRGV